MSPITSPTTTTPGTLTFMNSILDHRSPITDQIFQTAIMVSTYPSNSNIEPLPLLDYYLINHLIALARPHLSKRDLKRMDYMADARRSFYQGHHKFQDAYRALLDAHACTEILDSNFEELSRQLADTTLANEGNGPATIRRKLCALEIQRRSNNEDLRIRLENLRAKTERRQHTAVWFSNLKYVFLRDEMPWLTGLGKQNYEWAMGHRKERPTMGSLPAPSLHQRRVTDGADSDHCSDSGGTTTADVEMQDSGLEMSVNEGEAEGMLQGERIELIVGSSAVRWVEGIATSQEKQVQC